MAWSRILRPLVRGWYSQPIGGNEISALESEMDLKRAHYVYYTRRVDWMQFLSTETWPSDHQDSKWVNLVHADL